MQNYILAWNDHRITLGRRTRIMGILNVTPDSFSDGGYFYDHAAAIAHGEQMVADGADIIDIGGESTRPFSEPVSQHEETRRVIPVIEALAQRVRVPISIDTTKAAVAERALDAGAAIINDISALRQDPQMAPLAARAGVPVILMHMQGTPSNMQVNPQYTDLLGEIHQFFKTAIEQAQQQGIGRKQIVIDPGIGFGKNADNNLQLLKELSFFCDLQTPLLVGSSRKAFIRNLLKNEDHPDIDPLLPLVETGTQASVSAAVLNGAHIVRVHDVANTAATVKILDAVRNCGT